jgi:regulator of replication initiation timing
MKARTNWPLRTSVDRSLSEMELLRSQVKDAANEIERLQAENDKLREDIEIIERKLGEGWIAELAISLAPQEKE